LSVESLVLALISSILVQILVCDTIFSGDNSLWTALDGLGRCDNHSNNDSEHRDVVTPSGSGFLFVRSSSFLNIQTASLFMPRKFMNQSRKRVT